MAEKKINISSEHKAVGLTSLSKTVLPLARQILGTQGLFEADIIANWQYIVGKDVALYSLPQKIRFDKNAKTGGCLTICVLSGAFAVEIKQQEQNIVGKINAYYGYEAISKLKIMQTGSANNFLVNKKIINKVKKTLVSDKEKNYINELSKGVQNQDLRQALERLGQAVMEKQKE